MEYFVSDFKYSLLIAYISLNVSNTPMLSITSISSLLLKSPPNNLIIESIFISADITNNMIIFTTINHLLFIFFPNEYFVKKPNLFIIFTYY